MWQAYISLLLFLFQITLFKITYMDCRWLLWKPHVAVYLLSEDCIFKMIKQQTSCFLTVNGLGRVAPLRLFKPSVQVFLNKISAVWNLSQDQQRYLQNWQYNCYLWAALVDTRTELIKLNCINLMCQLKKNNCQGALRLYNKIKIIKKHNKMFKIAIAGNSILIYLGIIPIDYNETQGPILMSHSANAELWCQCWVS